MAMVYRILTSKDDVSTDTWFSMMGDSTRETRSIAGPLNVKVTHGRLEIRRHFCSVRVTSLWNAVPSLGLLAASKTLMPNLGRAK